MIDAFQLEYINKISVSQCIKFTRLIMKLVLNGETKHLKFSLLAVMIPTGYEHFDCLRLVKNGVNVTNALDLSDAIRLVKDSIGYESGDWFKKIDNKHTQKILNFLERDLQVKDEWGYLEDWMFFNYYYEIKGIGDCLSWDELDLPLEKNEWIDHKGKLRFQVNENMIVEIDNSDLPLDGDELNFENEFETSEEYFHYFYSESEYKELLDDLYDKFKKLNAFLYSIDPKIAFETYS